MHIAWHGFFRVGSPAKVDRLAQRMADAMGREVDVVRAERYWKDPELHDVRLRTPLVAATLGPAVVETLELVQAVGGAWRVTGPLSFADGAGRFNGELSLNAGDRISVPGIELLLFEVRSSAGDVALGVASDQRPG